MELREELIWAGRELLRRGLTVYTAGNISVRTVDNTGFYIKPSSLPYPDIQLEDLVTIDWAGNILCGTRPPSIEHSLHRQIYLARPDVVAVVHTHSPHATTVAASKLCHGIPPVLGEVWGYLGGPIELAEYAPPGTPELAQNAVKCLGQDRHGILLKNHGAVAVGKSLRQALDFAEIIEKSAESLIMVQLLGGYDEHPEAYRRPDR
jgi:L-fuculose-phosphate aldolase